MKERNRKEYTDAEKAMFLLALEANGGNLSATHRETGVPISTLSRWSKGEAINEDVAEIGNQKRGDFIGFLRELAWKLAEAIPGKIDDATLAQTSTSMGIVIDKAQLLSGQPTDIVGIQDGYQAAVEGWLAKAREEQPDMDFTDADAIADLKALPQFADIENVLNRDSKTVQ